MIYTKVLAASLTALTAASIARAAPANVGASWSAAWSAPAVAPLPADYPADVREYTNVTVRQTLRLGSASRRLRVVLTNELGSAPVQIGAVRVARCDAQGRPMEGTDRLLTFGGQHNVSIPPGTPLYSDPVELAAPALSELEISVFYPNATRPAAHAGAVLVSPLGDNTAEMAFPDSRFVRGPALASRVDVQVSEPSPAVLVALGDSINEGPTSRPGHHLSWPEQLSVRLPSTAGASRISVVNMGIGGNRLLHDGPGEGPSALARFDRDVLAVPGVCEVVLLEGVNDIGFAVAHPEEKVAAADILFADRQLIARAHGHGLRIFGATLTPFEGAAYYTPEGERTRQTVNAFVRSGVFDGVLDFDAALRDPSHPSQLLPAFARPDHLHPSDVGFAVMARSVPLQLLEDGVRPYSRR